MSWSYDSFSNRLRQTALSGYVPESLMSFSAGNNRADQLCYDAAGNVLANVPCSEMTTPEYSYDAEGTMISSEFGAVHYTYDAEGHRVAKQSAGSVTNIYFYDVAGRMTVERDGNLNLLREELYVGNRHVATRRNGQLIYAHTNWLGTEAARSDSNGNLCETLAGLPFGDGLQTSGNCDPTTLTFTGKERDTESGLDYFGARYYGSSMGRWMSPDSLNVTEERLMNPSSTLNKYAYGGNSPLKYIDPDGLDITYFYDPGLPMGHAVLFAYNQANGDSAIESFGPASKSILTRLQEVDLEQVPAKSMFDLDTPRSPDDLRQTFAAMTIQTSPELTQQVIDYMHAHPDPATWGVEGPNCSSQVLKILAQFKLASPGFRGNNGLTPYSLWVHLYGRYVGPDLGSYTPFQKGADSGHFRFSGFDAFDLLSLTLKGSPEGSVTTTQGPGTPCGGNTGTPCGGGSR